MLAHKWSTLQIIYLFTGERTQAEAHFLQKVQGAQATQSDTIQEEQGKACLPG